MISSIVLMGDLNTMKNASGGREGLSPSRTLPNGKKGGWKRRRYGKGYYSVYQSHAGKTGFRLSPE
jgi:hypothetical protein